MTGLLGSWSAPGPGVRDDPVGQGAQAFDGQLDDVARLEPAPRGLGGQLEDAAGADRARAEHVAGAEPGLAAGVRDELGPGPVHARRVPAGELAAVDRGGHLEV